jgi:hypothetical protein
VCKSFGIEKKVFKIITDSASNNIKAFKNAKECESEKDLVARLVNERRRIDLREERLAAEEIKKKAKEDTNKQIHEAEIAEMNAPVVNKQDENESRKRKR